MRRSWCASTIPTRAARWRGGGGDLNLSDLAGSGPEVRRSRRARCSDRDYAFYRRSAARAGSCLPRCFGGATNWRDASDAEVRPLLNADGVTATRCAVGSACRGRPSRAACGGGRRPRPALGRRAPDAARGLCAGAPRRRAALRALRGSAACCLPAWRPRAFDVVRAAFPTARNITTRRPPTTRATASRTSLRAAEHKSNALPQTLLLDALGAPRPPLRALLARRRPGCVPRRPPSRAIVARTTAVDATPRAAAGRKAPRARRSGPAQLRPSPLYETTALHAARRVRLPRGARRPGAGGERR